jgi:histidinol phosphatase-like PHP family hydrolase
MINSYPNNRSVDWMDVDAPPSEAVPMEIDTEKTKRAATEALNGSAAKRAKTGPSSPPQLPTLKETLFGNIPLPNDILALCLDFVETSELLDYQLSIDDPKLYREIWTELVKRDLAHLFRAKRELLEDTAWVLKALQIGNSRADDPDLSEAQKNRRKELIWEPLFYIIQKHPHQKEVVLAVLKHCRDQNQRVSNILFSISDDPLDRDRTDHDWRNDRDIVLEAVKQHAWALRHASDALKNDRDVVLEAVNQNYSALEYASDALKNDREMVLKAVKQNGLALEYASDTLKNDRDIVLVAVNQNGRALNYASDALKNERDIVLEAVKKNGWALEYAGDALKNDREIVLEAVKQNGWALQHASNPLKNDREIVLEAVKQNGWALQHASNPLKNDREIVLEAVKNNGLALDFASNALQNDREIVLEAVKKGGGSLECASDALKNDREIVFAAVREYDLALEYASDALKNDREIVLEAVKQNGWALQHASDALKNDREIVLEAVRKGGDSLEYASDALKNDREIVLEAVKQNGLALEYASDALKNDREIVLTALQSMENLMQWPFELSPEKKDRFNTEEERNCAIYDYIGKELKDDQEIKNYMIRRMRLDPYNQWLIRHTLEYNGNLLQYADRIWKNNVSLVFAAYKENPDALQYAHESLRDGQIMQVFEKCCKGDKESALELVKRNGLDLEYCGEFRKDIDVIQAAITQNEKAFQYADRNLQHQIDGYFN